MNIVYDNFVEEDLIETLLKIDEDQFGYALCHKARNEFEILVNLLVDESMEQLPPSRQVAAINRILFRNREFRNKYNPRDEVFTLTATLNHRKGACLGLTAVYFALSQHLSIPIYPLMYEGHITVGHTCIEPPQHIEVCQRGALLSRKIASRTYNVAGGRPVTLTKKQFVAVYLSNRAAFVLVKEGELEKALETLEIAIDLFPKYAGAWINRGSILYMLGNRDQSIISIDHALSLNPVSRYKDVAQRLFREVSW